MNPNFSRDAVFFYTANSARRPGILLVFFIVQDSAQRDPFAATSAELKCLKQLTL